MSRNRFLSFPGNPAIALMAFAFALTGVQASAAETTDGVTVLDTRMALRDLWVEHVFWIRSYVVATHAGDAKQAKAAEQEVVANAKALAGSIAPYYGEAASARLFELLAGHWTAVRDYNSATLHTPADQEKAKDRIVSNARDIAGFLSGANPHLPEDAVFGLLASHGGHHMEQINQVSANDFAGEARTWHAMRGHMLAISDAIVAAIAKQFPEKFRAGA